MPAGISYGQALYKNNELAILSFAEIRIVMLIAQHVATINAAEFSLQFAYHVHWLWSCEKLLINFYLLIIKGQIRLRPDVNANNCGRSNFCYRFFR